MASWYIKTSAGTEYELSVANGIAFRGAIGHRMAPVQNVSTPYALVDGALYQRTAVRPRVLTLLIDAIGTSEATLVALENTLVTHTNPHRSVLPVQIWYRSGAAGTGMYINAYYEGGLEGGIPNGFVTSNIPMRFLCTDPFWYYETAIAGQALDVYDAMVTPNYIIQRNANGTWNNMDAGADAKINCLAVAANGDIYAGGGFANIGGVACSRIARYDFATSNWVAMGAGCDDDVNALAITANGDLYVGGKFHNAGGGAALHIAKYVHSTTTWSAVGAGLDDVVSALYAANNGDVYAGGTFLNVSGGGIAAARIAKWTAAGAWAALGAGVDGQSLGITGATNGDIYTCGAFTNAGGAGAARVAKWNGTAWAALGTGLGATAYDLVIASNGDLYVGGTFTTAGGDSANYIAKWNGVSWSALGSGLGGAANRIIIADTGELYASGDFTTAGGRNTSRWAIWENGQWVPAWVGSLDLEVTDMVISAGKVLLAGSFTTATTPGVTTITTTCSARAYPVIAITGPGRLLYLINYTTNQVIYFDITLVASEVLTIDLRERVKTVTSSFRGNLISGVLAGALTNWYLQPGTNYIGCYVDNVTASAVYGYTPRYWGAT